MENVKSSSNNKLVGIVKVVTGENVAKFTMLDEDKTFANGTDSIKVNLSDLPKNPKLEPNDKSGKEYRIRMNSEGDKVEALTPVRGHFPAKLVDLGPRPEGKDSDPVPAPPFKPFNEKDDHLEFFAVYQITSGAFKGVQLPAYRLHYKFTESRENPGFTAYKDVNLDNPKATRARQLVEWMQIHGLEDGQIKWDDTTILPILLKKALNNDVSVEVNISKGYILKEGGVVALESYESEIDDEDSVDEAFPPVKAKKRTVAEINKELGYEDEKPSAKPVKKVKKVVEVEEDEDDEL